MTNAWEKTGRDAAHEDIAGGAEPCTTLDEARRRIGQWLRSQTPAVAAVDADVCAAAYLRAWEAHARDTSHRAGLDLDAAEVRAHAARDLMCTILGSAAEADPLRCALLVVRHVERVEAERDAARREGAEARQSAYVAGRTDGAARMRRACEMAAERVEESLQLPAAHGAGLVRDAIRALPLPEGEP